MSKNGIQINKVKYMAKQEHVIVAYDRTVDGHISHHVATFEEEPAPEFFDAMDALTRPCCNMFDFDAKYEDRLSPYSVTFHYDGDGTMGAVISCKLEIPSSNTSIAINTPSKRCPKDEVDAQDAAGFFSSTMVKVLWGFENEARKYLSGKRNQMTLFGEDGEVTDADAACEAAGAPTSDETSVGNKTYANDAIPPVGAIQSNVVGFPAHNASAAR